MKCGLGYVEALDSTVALLKVKHIVEGCKCHQIVWSEWVVESRVSQTGEDDQSQTFKQDQHKTNLLRAATSQT